MNSSIMNLQVFVEAIKQNYFWAIILAIIPTATGALISLVSFHLSNRNEKRNAVKVQYQKLIENLQELLVEINGIFSALINSQKYANCLIKKGLDLSDENFLAMDIFKTSHSEVLTAFQRLYLEYPKYYDINSFDNVINKYYWDFISGTVEKTLNPQLIPDIFTKYQISSVALVRSIGGEIRTADDQLIEFVENALHNQMETTNFFEIKVKIIDEIVLIENLKKKN